MITTAVANLKGGVGKSTTTLFLAEHWAFFQKRKILVIDLDPQANASYMLLSRVGVEQAEHARKTLPHLLEDVFKGRQLNPMAYVVPKASDLREINGTDAVGHVSIVPSIPRLWFGQHDFDRGLYLSGKDPVEILISILDAFIDSIAITASCSIVPRASAHRLEPCCEWLITSLRQRLPTIPRCGACKTLSP